MNKTIPFIALIIVAIAAGSLMGESWNQEEKECRQKYGEDMLFIADNTERKCFNETQIKENIVELIQHNQPITTDSIWKQVEPDRPVTEDLLRELEREGKIYSYDRGFGFKGWETLKKRSNQNNTNSNGIAEGENIE